MQMQLCRLHRVDNCLAYSMRLVIQISRTLGKYNLYLFYGAYKRFITLKGYKTNKHNCLCANSTKDFLMCEVRVGKTTKNLSCKYRTLCSMLLNDDVLFNVKCPL